MKTHIKHPEYPKEALCGIIPKWFPSEIQISKHKKYATCGNCKKLENRRKRLEKNKKSRIKYLEKAKNL